MLVKQSRVKSARLSMSRREIGCSVGKSSVCLKLGQKLLVRYHILLNDAEQPDSRAAAALRRRQCTTSRRLRGCRRGCRIRQRRGLFLLTKEGTRNV